MHLNNTQIVDITRKANIELPREINNGLVIVGNSGVGISTISAYLSSKKLISKKEDLQVIYQIEDSERNQYQIPKIYKLQNKEISIIDYMGFNKIGEINQNFLQNCVRSRIFGAMDYCRFLFTIQYNDILGTNHNRFRQAFIDFYDMFSQIEQIIEQVVGATSLLINRVPKQASQKLILQKLSRIQIFKKQTKIDKCFKKFMNSFISQQKTLIFAQASGNNKKCQHSDKLINNIMQFSTPCKIYKNIEQSGKISAKNIQLKKMHISVKRDLNNHQQLIDIDSFQQHLLQYSRSQLRKLSKIVNILIQQIMSQQKHENFYDIPTSYNDQYYIPYYSKWESTRCIDIYKISSLKWINQINFIISLVNSYSYNNRISQMNQFWLLVGKFHENKSEIQRIKCWIYHEVELIQNINSRLFIQRDFMLELHDILHNIFSTDLNQLFITILQRTNLDNQNYSQEQLKSSKITLNLLSEKIRDQFQQTAYTNQLLTLIQQKYKQLVIRQIKMQLDLLKKRNYNQQQKQLLKEIKQSLISVNSKEDNKIEYNQKNMIKSIKIYNQIILNKLKNVQSDTNQSQISKVNQLSLIISQIFSNIQ